MAYNFARDWKLLAKTEVLYCTSITSEILVWYCILHNKEVCLSLNNMLITENKKTTYDTSEFLAEVYDKKHLKIKKIFLQTK